MPIPEYLFIASTGDMYDTRRPNWSRNAPLRPRYRATSREICSTSDLRATLRAGSFAWPGGYTLAFLMDDGDALCFDCARAEYRQLSEAIRQKARNGWRPLAVACEADSDEECACAHCSKTIWDAKAPYCNVCGENHENPCNDDDLPEPGDLREWD